MLCVVQPTQAVDVSKTTFLANYYYNSILSDQDFADIASMSEDAIQGFLEQQGSYLAQYSENNRRAAKIIYDTAHGANDASGTLNGIVINTTTGTINPRLILVTLQKEQSLITLTNADREANVDQYNRRLERAMGYACPDGASCDARYLGFTKQVENASWQLRYNYEAAGQSQAWWDQYYSATSSVCHRQYIKNNTCSFSDSSGSYSVTLTNQATASLYRYTPHVFNGNYNVWKLFNTWFTASSTAAPAAPASVNDTNEVAAKTFTDKYKVEGSKATGLFVYFGNTQIAGPDDTHWVIEFTPDVGNKDYNIEYRNSNNNGTVVATKKVTVDRHAVGDINGDNKDDLLDLSLLGETFGQGVPDGDWRNLNPEVDSEVNILDLSILADKWTG